VGLLMIGNIGLTSATAFLRVIFRRFAGGVCWSCERMVVWWCVNVCVEAMVNSPVTGTHSPVFCHLQH